MNDRNTTRLVVVLAALVIALPIGLAGSLQRQTAESKGSVAHPQNEEDTHAEHAVVETMSHHHMHDDPHMRLTERRPERPSDRERAAAIVMALKPALEHYRYYHVTIDNGYQTFLPNLAPPVYHFT